MELFFYRANGDRSRRWMEVEKSGCGNREERRRNTRASDREGKTGRLREPADHGCAWDVSPEKRGRSGFFRARIET